ncbi:MAG: hypothetical protein V3V08_14755 [Nannocystaceae bacterium]
MWSADEIRALRDQLSVNRSQFAKLVGVDARTVMRWESTDGPRPKGSSAAVLTAIRERLEADPTGAPKLIQFLVGAAAVGGLAYILIKLLSSFTPQERRKRTHP